MWTPLNRASGCQESGTTLEPNATDADRLELLSAMDIFRDLPKHESKR